MPFLIGKKMIIMRRAYARQKMGHCWVRHFAYGKNGLRPPCAAGSQRAEPCGLKGFFEVKRCLILFVFRG
jgi:hypothetical protein